MERFVWIAMFRSRFARGLLALALTIAGVAGASFVYVSVVEQRNLIQLNELSTQLVHRAEMEVDYAILTLGAVDYAEFSACKETSRDRIRQLVLQRGSVKDIQARGPGGAVLCSSLGMTATAGALPNRAGRPMAARNDSFLLSSIGEQSDGLMRVDWKISDEQGLTTILNLDTLIFDVFPPALRDNATAEIRIDDGTSVARYDPEGRTVARERSIAFASHSARYPLSSELVVDHMALKRWNFTLAPTICIIGGLLGALAGLAAYHGLAVRPGSAAELQIAMKSGEIKPFFQPIFRLKDGAVVGGEVLARWKRMDGTFVPPDRFIPLAESCGLIEPLTVSLFREALRQVGPLIASQPDFKLAFNFTQDHFLRDGFLETVAALADEAGVSYRCIVIELTERQTFASTDDAACIAGKAQQMGFRIALDDTGSGHNGLSQVQDLPLDIIKIDKKFVDRINDGATGEAIVRMLVSLARELGKTTVAEGIETEDQRVRLMEFGVDQGQGYLVSRALPAEAFIAFVQDSLSRRAHIPARRERAA